MRRLWLGLLLLSSAPAWAQAADPSQANNGDFGGKLLLTADPEGFWTEWNKPENPTVNTTSRVTRSRPVYGFIVFHDCKAGADGKCKVTVRFETKGPDDKAYDEAKSAMAWNEAPAPGHNLLASVASVVLRLEPQDPLGRYEIKATLVDEIAGKSVTLLQYVTAEADKAQAIPTT